MCCDTLDGSAVGRPVLSLRENLRRPSAEEEVEDDDEGSGAVGEVDGDAGNVAVFLFLFTYID